MTRFDPTKFDHPLQVGGIRTGTIDYPEAGGHPVAGCRVAWVDTGSGLRFTVALDRGGDLVEAHYKQHNLVYLSPNGYQPPNPAHHQEDRWLRGWSGGLLTSCGPLYIGAPRWENEDRVSLHGHHSNSPAAIRMIENPDPRFDRFDMALCLSIRDSRMFGPIVETHREIRCTLGEPIITLRDRVINRSDRAVPHNWLYHINFGYPLLNEGTKLIFKGRTRLMNSDPPTVDPESLQGYKSVPLNVPWHLGEDQQVLLVEPPGESDGHTRVGLVNPRLELGVRVEYPTTSLPRLANWQHFGPHGTYVTGIEPYRGSLPGRESDPEPGLADSWLQPGESVRYELSLTVLEGTEACKSLIQADGPLTPA
jgi:hypothetical protein